MVPADQKIKLVPEESITEMSAPQRTQEVDEKRKYNKKGGQKQSGP
jgi:hypothetical protein